MAKLILRTLLQYLALMHLVGKNPLENDVMIVESSDFLSIFGENITDFSLRKGNDGTIKIYLYVIGDNTEYYGTFSTILSEYLEIVDKGEHHALYKY